MKPEKSASAAHKQIKNSDIEAFEALFRQYYAKLCLYSNSIVNDMDAAEEIVQDFFYNYWKNRETMTFRISLRSYMYKAIRNNSLKHLEHLNIRRRYAEEVMANSSESEQISLSEELDAKELESIIQETLKELPGRSGEIFKMNRFDGLKYHEIADELSISVKTVEANMSKALQIFRKKLSQYNRNRI
jgi:RNA polymerase sigma-70 factor, ECF subfamily